MKKVAKDAALTLDRPDISVVQVSRLLLSVEEGASRFDRILNEMDDADVDDELFEAGATIADTWTNLTVMTAKRIRAMHGLEPVEVASEENGEIIRTTLV